MLQVASSASPSLLLRPPSPMNTSVSGQDITTAQSEPSSSPQSKSMLAPIRNPTSISVASKSARPYPAVPSHHRRQQLSSSHQPFLLPQPEQQPLWSSNSAQSSSPDALYPARTPDHHHQPPHPPDDGQALDPASSNSVYSDFDSSSTNANFGAGPLEQEREHKQHQSSSSPSSHPRPISVTDPSNLGTSASINPHEVSSATISGDKPPSVDTRSSPTLPVSALKSSKSTRSKRPANTSPGGSSSSMAIRNASSGPRDGGGRSSQPKSSRKQFSACGACQLRQVKCDLKDKRLLEGENAACTACTERGTNCVSKYEASSKPKAQRRGKRLALVESTYGRKPGDGPSQPSSSGSGPRPYTAGPSSGVRSMYGSPSGSPGLNSSPFAAAQAQARGLDSSTSCIPPLHPDFLDSPFYRSFHTQRPIIDPHDFRERFLFWYGLQHPNSPYAQQLPGSATDLGITGQLIANILVTWAASYGIDEHGVSEDDSHSPLGGMSSSPPAHRVQDDELTSSAKKRRRRDRCNDMIKEMLDVIDRLGLLRNPSWDGVRVLMLLMPLTEDCLDPMGRLSMYQSTISQIYTLCRHGAELLTGSNVPRRMVVARIFWYAYVHEGITSGLRGGKLIFDNDDLRVFETSLVKFREAGGVGNLALTSYPIRDEYAYRFATAPIRLSTACRQVNYALTGPKASVRRDIDELQLQDGWERLTSCWDEFESLKGLMAESTGFMQRHDLERFISGWQIFIFECHNVIREALAQKLHDHNTTAAAFVSGEEAPTEQEVARVARLHELSESHCRDYYRQVIMIIHQQLDSPTFFQWDASLVRDGTFFAGSWAASESEGQRGDVDTCIQALRLMKWAFSLSESRIDTIRHTYERRLMYGGEGSIGIPGLPSSGGSARFGESSSRTGLLRENVIFSTPHLPSAPGNGQDAFEQYWNQAQPSTSSLGNVLSRQQHLPSVMSPSDGTRLSSVVAGGLDFTPTRTTSWDTSPGTAGPSSGVAWLNTGGPTINSVPPNKYDRASPEEMENSLQQSHIRLRASPPGSSSASSSSEFVRPNNAASGTLPHSHSHSSLPHSSPYRSQTHRQPTGFESNPAGAFNTWNGQDVHGRAGGSVGASGTGSFVEIDSSQQGGHMSASSYASRLDPFGSASSAHESHHHGADYGSHPQHAQSGSDASFLADAYQLNLNRTRFHADYDPSYHS